MRVAYVGCEEDLSGKEERASALLRFVLAEGGSHDRPALIARGKAADISERTVDRVLKALVKEGEAALGRDGKVVTYTATDLLAIA